MEPYWAIRYYPTLPPGRIRASSTTSRVEGCQGLPTEKGGQTAWASLNGGGARGCRSGDVIWIRVEGYFAPDSAWHEIAKAFDWAWELVYPGKTGWTWRRDAAFARLSSSALAWLVDHGEQSAMPELTARFAKGMGRVTEGHEALRLATERAMVATERYAAVFEEVATS